MIKDAIKRVVCMENLSVEEAEEVMEEIMEGKCTPAQIGAFITALRMKGETIEEITGFARVMRDKATRIRIGRERVVDTCGTGGDNAHTFNISTTTAFVVAGAGIVVAKHGNRSVSSRCGSADLLEAAGVRIDLSPKGVERCLEEVGIGFLFAPLLHGAMKYATPPRREIGIRTVFNILGPLTNPARANSHLLGVYDEALTEPLANVLKNLGAERAFLVHGMDGLDEITLTTQTKVSELVDGEVRTYYIKPEDFGLSPCSLDDLKGGDTQENLRIFLDVLNGMDGPRQDVVLMNAGAGIVAGGGARDIMEGIEVAREVIESGKALQKFESLKEYTNTEHHG